MPSLTFKLTVAQHDLVKGRATSAQMTPDEYARAVLLESIAPRTATADEIARTIGVTPETVRCVLAGIPVRASKESLRGIKAMAAEMGYRPTVKDIAAAAGMSPMAVSTALSGVGRISEASRIRIKAIAKEMGWRPSLLATSLRRKRS